MGDDTMVALEVATDGTIYGGSWSFFNPNDFFTINRTTGAATAIGSMGLSGVMDFAFDTTGTLWAVADNQLHTVNLATGAGSFVAAISGTTGTGGVRGITFDANNNLFATTFDSNSILYSVNPVTGAATTIGATGISFAHGGDILAPNAVPEPGSLLLLGSGVLGLMAKARRRKKQQAQA
jgi:hypothetical protein